MACNAVVVNIVLVPNGTWIDSILFDSPIRLQECVVADGVTIKKASVKGGVIQYARRQRTTRMLYRKKDHDFMLVTTLRTPVPMTRE